MFVRLLLLFTLVPIVELAVLIEIGQHLGVLPTVALVLATVGHPGTLQAQILEAWCALERSIEILTASPNHGQN